MLVVGICLIQGASCGYDGSCKVATFFIGTSIYNQDRPCKFIEFVDTSDYEDKPCKLCGFDFETLYKPNRSNQDVDTLSRRDEEDDS